jgi:hypothetical protein
MKLLQEVARQRFHTGSEGERIFTQPPSPTEADPIQTFPVESLIVAVDRAWWLGTLPD